MPSLTCIACISRTSMFSCPSFSLSFFSLSHSLLWLFLSFSLPLFLFLFLFLSFALSLALSLSLALALALFLMPCVCVEARRDQDTAAYRGARLSSPVFCSPRYVCMCVCVCVCTFAFCVCVSQCVTKGWYRRWMVLCVWANRASSKATKLFLRK